MRQPDAVTNMKQRLEKKLGEVKDDLHPEGSQVEEGEETISWTRPTITSGNAAWIYEVDLHHNIFHINEIPFFFRLDCIPDEHGFRKYTTSKPQYLYGNIAYPPDCPPCR